MFTNKIVKWMWENYSSKMNEFARSQKMPDYYIFENLSVYQSELLRPKLHTIREDKNNRWKIGMIIDYFIYPRNVKMFRFAPQVPVKGIQKIEINPTSEYLHETIVKVDGRKLNEYEVQQLAWNDGFSNLVDFWLWFNKDFTGKILHWGDMKY